jgi:hypothetical protein
LIELLYALADQATVNFQLCFAGTTQANAALLTLQVGPSANQARGQMFQLRQLNLKLAFRRVGTLCKNVEDEPGSVQHAATGDFFEITFLNGGKVVVHQHDIGVISRACRADFLGLALAHKCRGSRYLSAAEYSPANFGAGRFSEQSQFFEFLLPDTTRETQLHEQGALTSARNGNGFM